MTGPRRTGAERVDETEEAAEEIEEAPSATPVSTERLPRGCRGPRAAEGVGGMASAERPSSAAVWTKRERAGGVGSTMSRDSVALRWRDTSMPTYRESPGEDERRGQQLPGQPHLPEG